MLLLFSRLNHFYRNFIPSKSFLIILRRYSTSSKLYTQDDLILIHRVSKKHPQIKNCPVN
jgi:hypothetical protein